MRKIARTARAQLDKSGPYQFAVGDPLLNSCTKARFLSIALVSHRFL